MATVCIVTSGEYDSYRIIAVFSTKKLAKKYAAARKERDEYFHFYIEDWDVDADPEEED